MSYDRTSKKNKTEITTFYIKIHSIEQHLMEIYILHFLTLNFGRFIVLK